MPARLALVVLSLLILSGCDAFSSDTGTSDGVDVRYVVEGQADVSYLNGDQLDQARAQGSWEARFVADPSVVLSLEAVSTDGSPVNAHIEVEGVVVLARTGLAVRLDSRRDDRSSGEIEVHGEIEERATDRVTVLGRVFVLDAQTQWLGRNNEAIDASLFTVGTFVEAEGFANSDGTVQAKKIKLDDDGGTMGAGHHEIEVEGRVDALTEGSITVSGTRFAVDAATRWLDDDNDLVDRSTVTVGDEVEVEGYTRNGVLYAEKVREED